MRKMLIFGALAVSVCSPVLAKKAPQVSPLEMQQMQMREFEVRKEISFPAVMTVLQDAGYRIEQADKDTGLITGMASTKSKLTYNLFWGMGKKKNTPVVSAFIEDRGRGSRVRLNFVLSTTKNRIYGHASSDDSPIVDPQIYREAFEKIDREIFVRVSTESSPALKAATPPATASSPPSQ